MSFTPEEIERYARHIVLRELGGPGQSRLKSAHVLMVGAGGLGCPAAQYLAAAGVGTLTLMDADTVSLSNLQRQILFSTADVGRLKVEAAADRLRAINPHVDVRPRAQMLTPENAAEAFAGVDVVVEGLDSFDARFVVNAACRAHRLPLVSGAVERFSGQVAIFDAGRDADAPCYRCLTPHVPPGVAGCAQVGVVGAMAGVVGTWMALETVKLLTGAGETLSGRLLMLDGLSGETRTARLRRDPDCPECGGR